MDKFVKSSEQIKSQILNRFDKNSDYLNYEFKVWSKVLHFEDFSQEIQNIVLNETKLNEYEIPIILSYVDLNIFLLLTTENFHNIENSIYNKIELSNFEGGTPDEDEIDKFEDETGGIYTKNEGHIVKFYLHKKDNTDLEIKIYSGGGLYSLWNTFKTFELVGRKCLILEYQS